MVQEAGLNNGSLQELRDRLRGPTQSLFSREDRKRLVTIGVTRLRWRGADRQPNRRPVSVKL